MIITDEQASDPNDINSTADSHPARYSGYGGIECIDAIRESLGHVGFVSMCMGQVMRYLWRYKSKNGSNDLRKAMDYMDWALDELRECEDGVSVISALYPDRTMLSPTVTAVRAALGPDGFESYCIGSCLRYACEWERYGCMGLRRAKRYLELATEACAERELNGMVA